MEKGDKELRWEIQDVLGKQDFESIYKSLDADLNKFKQIKKKLEPSMNTSEFKKIIDYTESLKERSSRLNAYVALILASNIKDKKSRQLQSMLDNLSIKASDASMFLSHWMKGLEIKGLKKLDDKNANRLFKSIPDLTYSLQRSREAAKYTLSEQEERIIHRKDSTGVEVLNDIYDLIVNDFKYEVEYIEKGKKITKIIENQQELISLAHSPNPKIREAAYKALFKIYNKNIDKFFLTYSAVARDWKMEAELRSFTSPISVRNFANNIPDKAIEILLKVCSKNVKIFQEYFRIKAKLLGMKKLRRCDIYAPLHKDNQKEENYSFKEAQDIIFETFEEFSLEFANKAKLILTNKHIDSHPRKNKRNGAFCIGVTPKVLPYVLTNYDYKMRDVSTLAHELGHAVHDIYASDHYHSAAHAPLPLCETASTFGEMIVFEKMLARIGNVAKGKDTKKVINEKKKALLIDKISDSYATIIRQNYFIKFEIEAHEMLMKGCTEHELSELYFKTLKEQFGDSIIVSEEFKHEWAFIPHIFHSPFYCYAYSFGELLSLALFAMYKKEGKKFIPKLEKVLMAGGSQDPVKLLKSVGVDIYSEKFWQGGFDVVNSWVKELKKGV
ncbi:MAG: M3 family oligoendopeptidase [archaeon]|nr:M3 family oligoendopeptidase [Nanoarchaeota archaeon]